MTSAWTLRVQIEDGCNFDFGFDKNECIGGFFRCVFNNCVNQSSIIRLPTFLSYDIQPVWNEALEWQFDDKTLKKLKKCGSSVKLQLFMIQNWNERAMSTFPIKKFVENKQKYHAQEIGYIVLDLKSAISNGVHKSSKIIESTYHRIRNIKIIKNNGVYPQIKVSFWCALQKKWNDENQNHNNQNNQNNNHVPCVTGNKWNDETHNHNNNNENTNNVPYVTGNKWNEDHNNNNNNNVPYVTGNEWFCMLHGIEMFVDLPTNMNCRLLIVSMNERFIFKLPLLTQTSNNDNELSNDYPHFSWYLQSQSQSQSSTADTGNTDNWSTIASYCGTIDPFISSDHLKTFVLKLRASNSHKQCVAKATISVSWQSYTKKKKKEKKEAIIAAAEETASVYSSFSVESTNNNDDNDDGYMPFNTVHGRRNIDYNKTDGARASSSSISYKYRIGIDIRSVRDLVVAPPLSSLCSLQCKYKYNLFDNNRLFESHPSSVLAHQSISQSGQEKTIENGFCAYEVVLQSNALKDNLYRYPLIVSIQCVDTTAGGDHVCVTGYSFIDLYALLEAKASASNLRYLDEYHTIYSVRGGDMTAVETYSDLENGAIECKAIGNMRVCCSLEEFEIISAAAPAPAPDPDTTKKCTSIAGGGNCKYLEKEIQSELENWKLKQKREWEERWRELESKKLNDLELEWKKCEELRSAQLNRKKLEIIKLEKKLKASLFDIEAQEKKIKMEQSRIEERKRELQQSYKLKKNEIVSSLKRLRNDHKMEIETLNRTIKFLKSENELISSKYKSEERRCAEFRAELNKNQKHFDASSMGQLQLENNKLSQEMIQLKHRCNDKCDEIEELNAKITRLELQSQELRREVVETQQKQIEKEKKQMEKLKVELMAKSHFKQLRNDRNELLQIKNTLNQIMNHS